MIKLNKNITFNFIRENSRFTSKRADKISQKGRDSFICHYLDKNMAEYLVKFMCST